MSPFVVGDDAQFEFFVFRVTEIRGFWGPFDSIINTRVPLYYNSMLSVTILPTVFLSLTNIHSDLLFKLLYPFIFSLVPTALYGIYKNEVGRSTALIAVLFFVFTINAFFGELIGVNRQIVGEFFLVLSIFLWLDKAMPLRDKRLLLIIFGFSLAISHYSIAILYIILLSFIVTISSIKPKFDEVFNTSTILTIFGITFLWYAFSTSSILIDIIATIQNTFAGLANFNPSAAGVASTIYGLPDVFTVASWINLVTSGIVTVSLAMGIFIVILCNKSIQISGKYRMVILCSAAIFAISYLFPTIGATINFTRFYAITFLFLSPCIPLGAFSLLKIVESALKRKRFHFERSLQSNSKISTTLVALLLCTYLFSQSGFVNYVVGGAIHSTTFDHYRIYESNDPTVQIWFNNAYIYNQDALSALWLSKYMNISSIYVYADISSASHTLTSQGLIPWRLIGFLFNDTKLGQGDFLYLSNLNLVKGIVPSSMGIFNTTELSLNRTNLIYCNGASEIRQLPP
jgi:uncharacterized membrane protein